MYQTLVHPDLNPGCKTFKNACSRVPLCISGERKAPHNTRCKEETNSKKNPQREIHKTFSAPPRCTWIPSGCIQTAGDLSSLSASVHRDRKPARPPGDDRNAEITGSVHPALSVQYPVGKLGAQVMCTSERRGGGQTGGHLWSGHSDAGGSQHPVLLVEEVADLEVLRAQHPLDADVPLPLLWGV